MSRRRRVFEFCICFLFMSATSPAWGAISLGTRLGLGADFGSSPQSRYFGNLILGPGVKQENPLLFELQFNFVTNTSDLSVPSTNYSQEENAIILEKVFSASPEYSYSFLGGIVGREVRFEITGISKTLNVNTAMAGASFMRMFHVSETDLIDLGPIIYFYGPAKTSDSINGQTISMDVPFSVMAFFSMSFRSNLFGLK